MGYLCEKKNDMIKKEHSLILLHNNIIMLSLRYKNDIKYVDNCNFSPT